MRSVSLSVCQVGWRQGNNNQGSTVPLDTASSFRNGKTRQHPPIGAKRHFQREEGAEGIRRGMEQRRARARLLQDHQEDNAKRQGVSLPPVELTPPCVTLELLTRG